MIFFLSNISIYCTYPSYRRSLLDFKREHPALQNMKFLNIFMFLWVIFALLDPNPDPDPLT
jgi:hypothetical protein